MPDAHAAAFILVITTCSSPEEAARIASLLVENRLAACVQSSRIESTYRWQGAVESAAEVRLMIKSRAEDFEAIEHLIKRNHSYQTPEIVATPIHAGSREYLAWLYAETSR